MIYVFIGTKAQYIKTAPLLRLMQDRNVDYRLIDSGQHAAFATGLREELGVKEPDVALGSGENIATVGRAVTWLGRYLLTALFRPRHLRSKIFGEGSGTCVIHGDTPSTLLALVMAKRVGMKVVHVEAGLRSFNLCRPFPEELIRIVCMRWADVLFTPSPWATENLRRMRVRGSVVELPQNTNVEAMWHAMASSASDDRATVPYCVMTAHRVETVLNRRRLLFAVELAEQLAQRLRVVFVLHPPTERRLLEYGLMERLRGLTGVSVRELVPHGQFLQLISSAEFVVTDGGSIQEETFYLDVPCLVLRNETERTEGLGINVRLARFDQTEVDAFLAEYTQLKRGERVASQAPSEVILTTLLGSETPR